MITDKFKLPYYAVIFTSLFTDETEGYNESAQQMVTLAKEEEGFLGIESVREEIGITVSYWNSLEAIINWKNNVEHTVIREKGRATWYKKYQVRICKVEREYGFEKK
ncbi:antibiotic biosynthesis monooxygenase [Tenacibaculum sp. S7007]|uniref:Antibiotic biosynthesis monooxygenase n=1 Tax=Tenacibaculum pelagium TaxID=2759527 RepID=A0A839AM91_9FLAO|nr:antibiotic biosynthesis monooxygenase [Tenacibaculum pelagium]MBA6155508.1 antibiotic biosynthesis monooxygenase [Tenacibaculum pelagium]